MEFTQGMVVKSKAGRDKNKFQLVLFSENGFVFVADGDERKISKPKKKNPRHLQKTSVIMDTTAMTDKKLRNALRTFSSEHDIAEESD